MGNYTVNTIGKKSILSPKKSYGNCHYKEERKKDCKGDIEIKPNASWKECLIY